ncbi:hypothetical protein [Treponema sp.]
MNYMDEHKVKVMRQVVEGKQTIQWAAAKLKKLNDVHEELQL